VLLEAVIMIINCRGRESDSRGRQSAFRGRESNYRRESVCRNAARSLGGPIKLAFAPIFGK
jgi:hypothetical protein